MFRPLRPAVSGHTAYEELPRRGFGPHRPYFLIGFLPTYSAALDFLRHLAAGKQPPHTPPGDDPPRVAIGVAVMPAVLADKRGLQNPVVRMDVPALGTFLRGLIRIDPDTQLTGLDGLVLGESNRFTPCGG